MMLHNLLVERVGGEPLTIQLAVGQSLFILGANGTGKSSLLQRFLSVAGSNARRITATRQTWFQADASLSAQQKKQFEQFAQQFEITPQSRYMEHNPGNRSGITLYGLLNAENADARAIATALRSGDHAAAEVLAQRAAPVEKINQLFQQSGMNIELTIYEGSNLVASKDAEPPYNAAELSDGERNALLIAADVLTAKPQTLMIIDEPERHLHRSIISPLLTKLFQFRPDCAFIVATHDLALPVDNPQARVLLLRSCQYSGQLVRHWDVDLLAADADIDEATKRDIVGARRKIVFVEGVDTSLDRPLYRMLFPNVSILAKGSSRDVEHAVTGIRASGSLHWVEAWGIIDNDGRSEDSIYRLWADGIFVLPFYSVESIFYHPAVVLAVAKLQAEVTGDDGEATAQVALQAAVEEVSRHLQRLASKGIEKAIRQEIFSAIPTLQQIEAGRPVEISVNVTDKVNSEVAVLSLAAQESDWTKLIARCPIRETQAPDIIARLIGLPGRRQYQSAVLQLLKTNQAMMMTVRSFFGDLAQNLV